MKRTLIALSCLVLFAIPAYGQGGILNDSVLRADGRPAIGATVRVCTEAASGTPCSPTASIYSDKALTIGIGPTLAVDAAGGYTYYALPGFYKEQLCLGATCVTRTVQVAADMGNVTVGTLNNICYADSQAGADAGFKIAGCITSLASGGGIVDARGLEGAQVISSTITVNKPVAILLGYATYTTSASPAFDFVRAGRNSSLIGIGMGSPSGGKSRIVAASSGVTPLVRILGTSTGVTANFIRIADLAIEGSDNADGQIGLLANFSQVVTIDRVLFTELGQAIDLDDVVHFHFRELHFLRCGTGDTPATATVRIENRTTPGSPSEQFWFEQVLWEGDVEAGNNQQGIALYMGPSVNQVWVKNSKMDYANTNPDFRIIVVEEADQIFFGPGNEIGASTITTAAAVVEVTGDSGNRATRVQIFDNSIGFSDTVTAVKLDWGNQNSITGGIYRGNGSGTAITVTSNHQAASIGPFTMASLDTAISNSSSTTVSLFQQQTGLDAWHMPEGLAVGSTPATTGIIRLPNNGIIRARDVGDSANINVIALNASDQVELAQVGTRTKVKGSLGTGNISPQSTGVIIPNNESYMIMDAGSSPVLAVLVDASDILKLGDDSDLASIVLGRAAVPVNALEGAASNLPRWILKVVDFSDMVAAATADTFALWTLPANTMIHDVVGKVVTGWSGGSISAAVCSVGTNGGAANDLTLDDNFFAAATVYELHDATASGGKGTLLFDSTDKFAPYMFVAGGVVEIQCDLTGDNHANATAGQARIYILVSQPLANTATEAN